MTPIKSIQYCAYFSLMPLFGFGILERLYTAGWTSAELGWQNFCIAGVVAGLVILLYPGWK